MDYQSVLLVLLAVLSLILTASLVFRIRSEKRRMAVLQLMNLDEFSDFVRTNSLDGSIQVVARRVSAFLKESFGCQRIIFLRKQRGYLELNYYFGIKGFRRDEFRVRFSKALAENLRQSPMPRSVEELVGDISESAYERLKHHKFDQFFPVFWRDNLYGLYFINSTLATETPSFRLLIASLAHSLSAAYHIKWHESRYQRLEERTSVPKPPPKRSATEPVPRRNILRLARYRQSDSLLSRIMESLKQEVSLTRLICLCEPKSKTDPLVIWQDGLDRSITFDDRDSFSRLHDRLSNNRSVALGHLGNDGNSSTNRLTDLLSQNGIEQLARFDISSRRRGLLAWSGELDPQVAAGLVAEYQEHVVDLMENAEAYEQIEALSNTDSLTGLANQRYFHRRLNEEVNRAKRYRRSLAMIIFDLDDLKGVNDRYGHLAGNAVLKRMGHILKSSIRAIDIIARYGGDEFCVIMPEADSAMCERFMQRLQQKIAESKFSLGDGEDDLCCTISQGGAVFPDGGEEPEALMKSADLALLRAKEAGRNRYLLCETALSDPSS